MKKLYNINSIGKTSLLFALSSLLLLTACSQEEDFAPQDGKDTPISIASVSVGDVAVTRALDEENGGGTLTGETGYPVFLRTFVQSPKGGKYCSAEGGEVWTNEGTEAWNKQSGETVYFDNSSQKQTITAFSHGLGWSNPALTDGKITYTIKNMPDLLFVDKQPVEENTVSLNMRHMMARVTVNITDYGNTMASTPNPDNIIITNLPSQVTFDPMNENGEYLQYAENEVYDGERFLVDLHINPPYYYTHRGIVIPRTSDEPITFGVVMEMEDGSFLGTTFQPSRKADDGNGDVYGLDSGYHYTLYLQVGADAISVARVTVEDWKDGGTIDAEEATEPEATYEINGSTMTVTVDEYTGSFSEAVNEAIKHGCETMIVNGTLSARQQTVLATTLLSYEGEVYLENMENTDVSVDALADRVSGCGFVLNNGTYEVYNASGLYAWNKAAQTNKTLNLTLMDDITLPTDGITVTDNIPSGSNWTVVGDESSPYTGTFNGNGKTISGLRITTKTSYTGLIGYLGENGKIENLTLSESYVHSTKIFLGSVVGFNYGGTIISCTHNGTVYSTHDNCYSGGIVGSMDYGNIIACTNSGFVIGEHDFIGGIVGDCIGSKVTACCNIGNVTALTGHTDNVGNIVGSSIAMERQIGEIVGCWTSGIQAIEELGRDCVAYAVYSEFARNATTGVVRGYDRNSTATTANAAITDMNSQITATGYQWVWNTGDAWPTLVKQTVTE